MLTFQIFSTIRRTATKSCIVLLLDVLTRQVPWPGDLDLYFVLQWLWTFCVDVQYLLNYKAYNHQTLQSASSQCTDSADTLTWWPWCSDFDIIYVNVPDLLKCKTSSHQTLHSASPRCTDLAGILTRWPWPIFCAAVPSTHFMSTFNISSTIRPTTIKPRVVLLNLWTPQVPWPGDLDLYLTHFTLFDNSSTVRPTTTISCIVLLLDVLN